MKDVWKQVDAILATLAPADANPWTRLSQLIARPACRPSMFRRSKANFSRLLVRISGARRILEIGTLGGYSTIWMARALPQDGNIVTLELDPRHAEIARGNLLRARVIDCVDVRVGPAIESLPACKPRAQRRSTWSLSTPTRKAIRNILTGRSNFRAPER